MRNQQQGRGALLLLAGVLGQRRPGPGCRWAGAVPVAAGALVCVLTACSVKVAGSGGGGGSVGLTAGSPSPQPAGSSLPLPAATARRLPPGVFYLLAGPNPLSCNLWEVSNSGHETQLTHNRANFGISSFGASRRGIVMADASTGVDELVRLTDRGVVPLPGQHLGSPVISERGQIAAVRPPGGTGPTASFSLVIKTSFSTQPRSLYRQHLPLGGLAWGPGSAVVALSSSHPPGTAGPDSSLVIVQPSGRVRTLRSDFANLSEAVWNERAPGIAVANWHGAGEIVSLTGTRQRLPAGWWPAAWNAAGTQLLVWGTGRPGSVGLWSPKRPAQVTRIGAMNRHVVITQAFWLRTKAAM